MVKMQAAALDRIDHKSEVCENKIALQSCIMKKANIVWGV